jgi:O-antigen/teichoic acid export membrane protein
MGGSDRRVTLIETSRCLSLSFARQFLVYGISGAASRLAAVVLVPLYTRTLSITEYGQLEVLLAVHALIVILAGMQVESAVMRDYLAAKLSGHGRLLAWSAIYLTVAGTLIIALVLFAAFLTGWLPGDFSGRTFMLLVALTVPAQLLGIQQVMLRFEGRSLYFAIVSFCDLALCTLFSVLFIVQMEHGLEGALWGIFCGKLSCMCLAWRLTFGSPIYPLTELKLVQRMLAYGVPAIPAVLVGWLQNAGSRLLLALALSLSDVAIAGVAIKVAALYGFVVYSFRLAWEPLAMAKLTALDSDPEFYSRALEWYVITMFPASGIAVLLGPYIVAVLAPPAYSVGGSVAIFFVLGQFWVGMTYVLLIGIHGARLTSRLLPVSAIGVLVNVALLFAIAPYLGVAAAGVGFLAGSICSALVAAYFSNKHFNTRFSCKLIVWTVLATTVFAVLWYQVLLRYPEAMNRLLFSVGLLGVGICLLFTLLIAIVFRSFSHGRMADMWTTILNILRSR